MNHVRPFIVVLCAILLSGCGFHLRDQAQLPPEMDRTFLIINDEYSQLGRELKTLLEQEGVQFVKGEEATAILEVPTNRVVTEVLTIGNNARVREYRVTHTVEFRLVNIEGQELLSLQTLRQSREISFDENRILANSREQEYLEGELAETLSRLMVQRLESIRQDSMPAGAG